MSKKIVPLRDTSRLHEILNGGSDEDLDKISNDLFQAAEDDPYFANIASDWLQYGRHGNDSDNERAAHFRKIAIEALVPDAIFDHALILDNGGSTQKSQALGYYVLSAILGDDDAIEALSNFFLYGESVHQDYFIAGALRKHVNLLRSRLED